MGLIVSQHYQELGTFIYETKCSEIKFSSIFQNLEENKIYLLMVPSQFDVR